MNVEQFIRRALDGTFTRVAHDHSTGSSSVVVDVVDREYIPTYEPRVVLKPRGKCRLGYHHWTEEEDAELVSLRSTGWSKMRCGLHFNVSESSIASRIKHLISIRNGNRT